MNRRQSLGGGARGFIPLKVKKLTPLQTDQNNVIMNNKFSKPEVNMKKGFTLAEVLITLGIIGVVAAMTLPTLVQNYKEQETVTRVKKFYSVFSQAYAMAVLENGTIDTWGLVNSERDKDGMYTEDSLKQNEIFIQKIAPYLKKIKYVSISKDNSTLGFVMPDGTRIVGLWFDIAQCSENPKLSCGDLDIATDRKSKYNRTSEDQKDPNGQIRSSIFNFEIFQDQIVPHGMRTDNPGTYFEGYCKTGRRYSLCTSWVILNGNMDYLHCPTELSWNGKTKCGR